LTGILAMMPAAAFAHGGGGHGGGGGHTDLVVDVEVGTFAGTIERAVLVRNGGDPSF
jgi:hypothetical protein